MSLLELIGKAIRETFLERCSEEGHQWEKFYGTELTRSYFDQIVEVRLIGYRCRRCGERRPWDFNPDLDD